MSFPVSSGLLVENYIFPSPLTPANLILFAALLLFIALCLHCGTSNFSGFIFYF
jgi:uncharacterized phage infection (PIP) family protein YhgE